MEPINPQQPNPIQPTIQQDSKIEQIKDFIKDRMLQLLMRQKQQAQTSKPTTTKPTSKPKQPPTDIQQPQPTVNDYLNDFHKTVLQYSSTLNNLASTLQEYHNEFQNTLKEMNGKLNEVMNLALIHLSKTPLGQFTNEDFLSHINTAINTLPYQALNTGLNSIIKGYYLAKSTGMDTSNLTFLDLLQISEDPTYLKTIDENTLKMLDLTAKTLTNGIDRNIQSYKVKADNLALQSEILKTAFSMLKTQADYDLENRRLNLEEQYKKAMLDLQRQELGLKAKELNYRLSQEQDPLNQLYKLVYMTALLDKLNIQWNKVSGDSGNAGGFASMLQQYMGGK